MAKGRSTAIRVVFTALLVSAATIPAVCIGYGTDGDSYAGPKAASSLWETGHYRPSRLPGNPLFECSLALIVPWGGHLATNLFVLATYLLALPAFRILVKDYDPHCLWTVLFALTPTILIYASSTMDYLPGLCLVLWCFVAAKRRIWMLSAVLLGLAVGVRATNVLFAVSLCFACCQYGLPLVRALFTAASGVAVGVLFYVPILLSTGLSAVNVLPLDTSLSGYVLVTGYHGLMLFGPLGTLGLLIAAGIRWRSILNLCARSLRCRHPGVLAELSTLVLFTVLFVFHSDEKAYLIPTIPFVYLLLARCIDSRALITLTSALVVSNGLVSIELMGGSSGRRHPTFQPGWGVVVADCLTRYEIELLRSRVQTFDQSEKAVILSGFGDLLTYQNPDLTPVPADRLSPNLRPDGQRPFFPIYKIVDREVFFVRGLSEEHCDLLEAEGFDLYMFSVGAPAVCIRQFGYDPYARGIPVLEIWTENAFYK